ncbi:unnamed protein product [Danaus chrysippus]|uniref:(African queen) hypothetical protein n=1 Tax=Danaus chrysippus TaxID=151541 RepID=A0A8J2R9U3_9NEOP|nr:unnamed protein product [Danaus chrysippus]
MDTPTSLELDFNEHWGNSIYDEVLRGKEVRNEKVKNNSTNSIYDYDFAKLNFDRPSCSKNGRSNMPRKGTSEDELYFLHVRKKRNKKGRRIKLCKELEKEEGHIWDIIDEIVYNTLLLCKEPSVSSLSVDAKSSDVYYTNDDDRTPSERHSDDENFDESGNIVSDIIENIINAHDYIIRDELAASLISNVDDTGDADRKTSSSSLERDIQDFIMKYIETVHSELFKSSLLELIDPSIIDNEMDNFITNTYNETDQENVRKIQENTNNDLKDTGTDLTELTSNDKGPTNNSFNDLENNGNDIQINEMNQNNTLENTQERNAIKHNFDVEKDIKTINLPSTQGQAKEMNIKLSQDKLEAIKIDHKDSDVANDLTTIENNLVNTEESEGKSPFNNVTSEDSLKKVKFSNITIGDVDEPWPENLMFPLVKATVSVSKSILSLGRIMEIDEKYNESRINSNMEDATEIEENSDKTKDVLTLQSLYKVADKLNKETLTSTDEEIQCDLYKDSTNVGTDIDRIRKIKCEMLSERRLSAFEIHPEIIIHQEPSPDVAKKDKSTEIKSSETNYSIPTHNPFKGIL